MKQMMMVFLGLFMLSGPASPLFAEDKSKVAQPAKVELEFTVADVKILVSGNTNNVNALLTKKLADSTIMIEDDIRDLLTREIVDEAKIIVEKAKLGFTFVATFDPVKKTVYNIKSIPK